MRETRKDRPPPLRKARRVWKIKPFERVKESKKVYTRKGDEEEVEEEGVEGRILAIDLGEKRVGLAISDPLLITAQGLKTVERIHLLQEIKNLSNRYWIEEIVMGHPLRMDGSSGEKAEEAEEYALLLENELKIPVTLFDERFTSKEAERTLHELGIKPSREREKVDEISAILILQAYLDRTHSKEKE